MNLLLNIIEVNPYFSGELWFDFISRFLVNSISLFVLIRFIFYPNNGQEKFLFIFYLTGLMIFLISSTLDQVTLNIGMALGLFAIFGIIRFRTPPVGLKEMTYLFISIGMAVINALVEFNIANWLGLLVANLIILISAFIMEKYRPKKRLVRKILIFTPSDFNIVNNNILLVNEIERVTGIKIFKADISKINKTKNELTVKISFDISKQIPVKTDIQTPEKTGSVTGNSYWISSGSNEF